MQRGHAGTPRGVRSHAHMHVCQRSAECCPLTVNVFACSVFRCAKADAGFPVLGSAKWAFALIPHTIATRTWLALLAAHSAQAKHFYHAAVCALRCTSGQRRAGMRSGGDGVAPEGPPGSTSAAAAGACEQHGARGQGETWAGCTARHACMHTLERRQGCMQERYGMHSWHRQTHCDCLYASRDVVMCHAWTPCNA